MLLFSIFVIGHLFWTRMVATAGDLKLSVEPQSGSVNTGDQVTFLCTIAGSEAGITFFLYKEGDKQRRMINSSEKAIEGKFQFRVQGSDEGTYYCVYDTEQFTSVAYSNRVKITVRVWPWVLILAIPLAVIVILHLVVILVWCRKPGNKKDLKVQGTYMQMSELISSELKQSENEYSIMTK
ncbi:Fc receptor-like protein 3 [Chiloscyllium punctatum]|uniref:Fc receptor-like protein 3 n=1 Tax=Chiloscyllium punctatum TaxID=137246 RepID=UPI003B638CF9